MEYVFSYTYFTYYRFCQTTILAPSKNGLNFHIFRYMLAANVACLLGSLLLQNITKVLANKQVTLKKYFCNRGHDALREMLPFLLRSAPIQHFRSCFDSDLLSTIGILVTVQFIGIRVCSKNCV